MRYLSCPGLAGEMRLVTGPPVIQRLIKQRGEDGQHKVLVCEAEGSPKPSVAWSINGTLVCNAHIHTTLQGTEFWIVTKKYCYVSYMVVNVTLMSSFDSPRKPFSCV